MNKVFEVKSQARAPTSIAQNRARGSLTQYKEIPTTERHTSLDLDYARPPEIIRRQRADTVSGSLYLRRTHRRSHQT
jgi:hypothetical protein